MNNLGVMKKTLIVDGATFAEEHYVNKQSASGYFCQPQEEPFYFTLGTSTVQCCIN